MSTIWPVVVTRRTKSSTDVLGVDAAVDEARVDPAAAQIACRSMSPFDAVEIDVALDGRHRLAAAQLVGDDAAAHVGDADAPAGRLERAPARSPDADTSPPKVLASTATSGGTSSHEVDAAAGERQRALAAAELDARVDLRSRRSAKAV